MRDLVTSRVRRAAKAHNVKFNIMYDTTKWQNMYREMPADWVNKMQSYTSSPACAWYYGKPVVAIWGFGYIDDAHPWTASACP